jgi:hypothetical protein
LKGIIDFIQEIVNRTCLGCLNQVNYALLHLHLAGKHDAKPSHEELKDWLHSGQVDVIRMNK